MPDKFLVKIPAMAIDCPDYFIKFWQYCHDIARKNDWNVDTVVNYQLKPLGGRFIFTASQGAYIRWDTEAAHTAFVLRWS